MRYIVVIYEHGDFPYPRTQTIQNKSEIEEIMKQEDVIDVIQCKKDDASKIVYEYIKNVKEEIERISNDIFGDLKIRHSCGLKETLGSYIFEQFYKSEYRYYEYRKNVYEIYFEYDRVHIKRNYNNTYNDYITIYSDGTYEIFYESRRFINRKEIIEKNSFTGNIKEYDITNALHWVNNRYVYNPISGYWERTEYKG